MCLPEIKEAGTQQRTLQSSGTQDEENYLPSGHYLEHTCGPSLVVQSQAAHFQHFRDSGQDYTLPQHSLKQAIYLFF